MRGSVPANLLLLGEYAVLEPGGLGVALAVAPRASFSVLPAQALVIRGSGGGSTYLWPPPGGGAAESPLLEAAVEACARWLEARTGGPPAWRAEILIETDPFFADRPSLACAGGRAPERPKRGFGSSAAVAVALCAVLLRLAGADPSPEELFALALRAHRRSQRGRGSGYDVAASTYGGAGMLQGGALPRWHHLQLPWLPPLALLWGPAAVSTPAAVARYRRWQAARPGDAARFLRKSNQAIRRFAAAASWREALPFFRQCRQLGLQLGERIGVPARIPEVPGLQPGLCKALGAGNEVGACVVADGAAQAAARTRGLTPVEICPEGLSWGP